MPPEKLDYCRPPVATQFAPATPNSFAALIFIAILLIASLLCCVTTWRTSNRFIFLPAGDTVMGFRSHAGWVDWIEYAEWENKEYPQWSLPWAAPIFGESLILVVMMRFRRRPTTASLLKDKKD